MHYTFGDVIRTVHGFNEMDYARLELHRPFPDQSVLNMGAALELTMTQICADYGVEYSPSNFRQICKSLGNECHETKLSPKASINAMMLRTGFLLLPKLEPVPEL